MWHDTRGAKRARKVVKVLAQDVLYRDRPADSVMATTQQIIIATAQQHEPTIGICAKSGNTGLVDDSKSYHMEC